jgi:hypothetical protein
MDLAGSAILKKADQEFDSHIAGVIHERPLARHFAHVQSALYDHDSVPLIVVDGRISYAINSAL